MASDETLRAEAPSPRGKPKGDKRQRTRTALLEAARALIREKGYERTTQEEVAKRAGMTTGAIYGNVKNRDDLLIPLGQAYRPTLVPEVTPRAVQSMNSEWRYTAGWVHSADAGACYLKSLGAKSFRARRQVSHSCAVSGDSK